MSALPVTLSVFTENRPGLLHRVTSIFTRRNVNIESLTVSASEVPGVHRFTILVHISLDRARNIALQLERQIEVIKAFVHVEEELVARDLAMFKVDISAIRTPGFNELVRQAEARILEVRELYLVVEKTGTQAETTALLQALEPFGILEFVRSGRVVITRPMRKLSEFLLEMEATQRAIAPLDTENDTWHV
jgi:acetolactate synthase-1/3 small subunit